MREVFTVIPKDLLLRMKPTDDGLQVTCYRDALPISPDTVLMPTVKRVALLKRAGMNLPDPLRTADVIRAYAAATTNVRARALAMIYYLSYDAANQSSAFMHTTPTKYAYLSGKPPESVPRGRRSAK